jgi:cation transport ATPase
MNEHKQESAHSCCGTAENKITEIKIASPASGNSCCGSNEQKAVVINPPVETKTGSCCETTAAKPVAIMPIVMAHDCCGTTKPAATVPVMASCCDGQAAKAELPKQITPQMMEAMYTCPMHPEVRQKGPGSCPLCGMALEPEMISVDDGENPELTDFRRRFQIGLALTLPVFVLEMGGHLFGMNHLISGTVSNWIQLLLATPVIAWSGLPFLQRGWQSLRTRAFNMFTLIAMGTGVAWIYSVIATLAPAIFPVSFRLMDGSVPVYFEAAAVIVVLVLLGQILELKARERTGGAIKALLGLTPKTARRMTDGG